ncbi:Alpha/Beta hydrolase protein [Phaeosphaeria sp. MPI-PUGE-AT-0046c]|nr:Alpha/Beta hydrolase protein [Phaeosphaeria sp. MPI-PUGE-AT-0046c]
MSLLLTALIGLLQYRVVHAIGHLDIETTSGSIRGFVNETTPNVAQFLGIPYAEPPVGSRRWLPPARKSKENGVLNATQFGPACSQWESDINVEPTVYTVDAPNFSISRLDYQSEDCLSLNVWTPWHSENTTQSANVSLPVLLWVYGGGFTSGSGNVPYQIPSPWIEKSGKHIVVSINHRMNVLGFPNAAGLKLEEQNLGMLDLRLAVEWTRDNIANFGGDPDRIVLWGQSSGAIAIDHYNFAHPEDTIVAGFIMHSGTSTLEFTANDPEHTNFTFVAEKLGCPFVDPTKQLDCMRGVDANDIVLFMKYYYQNATQTGLAFGPVVDNVTLFPNYTARALAGNFSRKPALIGNTANEGSSFVLPYNQSYGPGQDAADATTVGLFMCPTIQTSHDRYAANAATFRYLYAGNFTTLSPQWWEGAYHSSDIPMVFGTYGLTRGPGTELQRQVSEKMQEYWLAFVEDPVNGLQKLGWDSYENGSGEGVMFGYEGEVEQKIGEGKLDQPCDGLVPNGLPPPPR